MAQEIAHVDVLARNWVQAGASVWLVAAGSGAARPVVEEDRLGQGEVLAFRVGDIALRLWMRRPEGVVMPGGGLRLSIKSSGPVLVGEVGLIDLPALGSTFWVAPPVAWTAWDRRRAFRVRVQTYCQVWLEGDGGQGAEPLVRRVVNLSTTGMAIEGVPARLGERMSVVLELAPVAAPVRLDGCVVRQESAAMGAYTALDFTPDEEAQAAILQYLLAVSARQFRSALDS